MSEIGTAKQETEDKKPLNVLLVEDEEIVANLVRAVLGNHNITAYTTGEEALETLRKSKEGGTLFDWVITDRGLAGKMDGFALADLIKSEDLGKPYVTLLTGSAAAIRSEMSADELKDRGIHHLMGKPFKPNELTDSVNAVRQFKTQFQNPQI